MRKIATIGSSPSKEECAQAQTEGYTERAHKECMAYRNQIRRIYGKEPIGARLFMKSCPQEIGFSYELVCSFDNISNAAIAYASKVKIGCLHWDTEAKTELVSSKKE